MPPALGYLPELAEADAPPAIRAIYADIRRLGAVPMVALIWRHLATLPGVIEACWESVGPRFREGRVQEAAWAVARATALPPLPVLRPAALTLIGIGPAERATVATVLDAYNRANPVNLMAVRAILARLGSTAPAQSLPAAPAWSPPDAIAALPLMTPPEKISPAIRAALAELSAVKQDPATMAVPSLYRHLTDWPAFIGLIHAVLHPGFEDGRIPAAVADVRGRITAEADRLAATMAPIGKPAHRPEVAAAIDRFSGLIPEMIVVGGMLRRALT